VVAVISCEVCPGTHTPAGFLLVRTRDGVYLNYQATSPKSPLQEGDVRRVLVAVPADLRPALRDVRGAMRQGRKTLTEIGRETGHPFRTVMACLAHAVWTRGVWGWTDDVRQYGLTILGTALLDQGGQPA
jgi:hypothetical protein